MITFDFTYYQPKKIGEAVDLYRQMSDQVKQPLYYAGGTEILTFGRVNKIYTEAVIDLKYIPECTHVQQVDGALHIGAALPLSTVREALQNRQVFSLISETIRGIADQTSRNKITVGGNLCGTIIFREMTLPLLLTDSQIGVAGENGTTERSVHDVCKQGAQLGKNEFIAYVRIDEKYANCPSIVIKKRKQGTIGYPLVTVAAIKVDGRTRVALSGYAAYPFRSEEFENTLNQPDVPMVDRVKQAVDSVRDKAICDVNGSKEYRSFLLENVLQDILTHLEGDQYVQVRD